MTNRIDARFNALRAQGRAGLITFIMAGDPDLEATARILPAIADAGADLIEIGMPFTDPMADGPTIQAAGLRALAAGATLRKTLALIEGFRRQNATTPVILMGYYNPIHSYGVEAFCADAAAAGVDGLIIVDVPPEEDDELVGPARAEGLHFVRLVTPTSDGKRLPILLKTASGFLYYVSITGITGSAAPDLTRVANHFSLIRQQTQLPVVMGFGIRTAEQARAAAQISDGVVVGSAIIDAIAKAQAAGQDTAQAAARLVAELAQGVKAARAAA